MPRLSTTHRRKKKHAVGDMRERITLHKRAITAPVFGTAAPTETYDTGSKVWASVKTFDLIGAGQKLFAGIDPSEQPSHLFVIRWREFLDDCETPITSELRIRWRGDAYKIVKVIVPEERRKEYYELFAALLGDQDQEAND
jgi:head-tail adaptor